MRLWTWRDVISAAAWVLIKQSEEVLQDDHRLSQTKVLPLLLLHWLPLHISTYKPVLPVAAVPADKLATRPAVQNLSFCLKIHSGQHIHTTVQTAALSGSLTVCNGRAGPPFGVLIQPSNGLRQKLSKERKAFKDRHLIRSISTQLDCTWQGSSTSSELSATEALLP